MRFVLIIYKCSKKLQNINTGSKIIESDGNFIRTRLELNIEKNLQDTTYICSYEFDTLQTLSNNVSVDYIQVRIDKLC